MIVKCYNRIKTFYKTNYINVKIHYINMNIHQKRLVIILYIKPEIKQFYLIIHKMFILLLIQII